MATRPLIVDVVQHAFNAAFRDWRFPRLALDELAGLDLSVSVLTPPQPMTFAGEADLLAQLRPGIDGLIIEDCRPLRPVPAQRVGGDPQSARSS